MTLLRPGRLVVLAVEFLKEVFLIVFWNARTFVTDEPSCSKLRVILLPSGEYFEALLNRFSITCVTRRESPWISTPSIILSKIRRCLRSFHGSPVKVAA
jgi:hypothetical protein